LPAEEKAAIDPNRGFRLPKSYVEHAKIKNIIYKKENKI